MLGEDAVKINDAVIGMDQFEGDEELIVGTVISYTRW